MCDWYWAEGTDSDWRADGLQEDGELVYLKDAYGPKLAPVALSSEVGTAGLMVCSASGLPDGQGDGSSGPLALTGKPLLAEACSADHSCPGVFPRPLIFRDVMQRTAQWAAPMLRPPSRFGRTAGI